MMFRHLPLLPALFTLTMSICLMPVSAQASDGSPRTTKTKEASVAPPRALPETAAAHLHETAATLLLTGRIRNEQGQPLAGATVFLPGSAVVVSTDAQGRFTLPVPAAGQKTLRYGYGGYQDRDVVVTTSAPLTMCLQPRPPAKRRQP
ncbi:carboxypeptidase-like regulatory domain-containing protein [Hymenobacter sp. BT188]|uniref:carboxypeptidase-like regulatory domain-containing protein n=1 Tax=Hymenobacter sp. BT188 TaxID=2763504 RepID=UPI00165106CF|nr:carboxypeptidase-like regulatory domain-containing protein [Hymenobacter sp. BT188]MBC6609242.1 carboxypeptidase-like regulatory domain-containing protein [Hymenobacter sp. BT188]